MKRNFFLIRASILLAVALTLMMDWCFAQQQIKNVIIVTTDGLRWQEFFNGADHKLGESSSHGDSSAIFKDYWDRDPAVARKKLLPFVWGTVAREGQIYGNRAYNNNVNVANPYWFSYPGYNELLTGFPDGRINSNDFAYNPNETLLHFLNGRKGFQGKVAAFSAWDALDRILDKPGAGFPIYAAFDKNADAQRSEKGRFLATLLSHSFKPWGESECLDMFTHYQAMEFLQTQKPRVLFISYGETDEWAHGNNYLYYLNAAHQVDTWIGEIWDWVQKDPDYKDHTALVVTTDHGRGQQKWTSHARSIPGSDQMWFFIMGPGIAPLGEVKQPMQNYQKQLAQTIATLLGEKFVAGHPVADAIKIP